MATEMTAFLLITGTGKETPEPLRIIDLLGRFLQTPNKYLYPWVSLGILVYKEEYPSG